MANDQHSLFPEQESARADVIPDSAETDWEQLAIEASSVFTPHHPVNERALFSGRLRQISRLVQAVNQLGQHAILYGERGVGKTSLANVIHEYLSAQVVVLSPRVNADGGDTFDSVWRKAFDQVNMTRKSDFGTVGFGAERADERVNPIELTPLAGEITPEIVRQILSQMSADAVPIMIFDEFDRLPQTVRSAFADLIKTLSDQAVEATIVLVGVAETIEQLIESHQSVSRALVQIPIPRMTPEEIEEIIDTGLERLGMDVLPAAEQRIVLLSQGLPYYTHLVCQHAVIESASRRTLHVTTDIVNRAIGSAIEDMEGTIKRKYHRATTAARKESLFEDVLLACALAQPDDLGYFTAKGVVSPLCEITKRSYGIPTFAQHLDEFSSAKRENVLIKEGSPRRFRFRFADPLMQPYVVMQGLAKDKITEEMLARVGR